MRPPALTPVRAKFHARAPVPGRDRDDKTIIFWYRGPSLPDIALAHAMIDKGERLGVGQKLRFG